MSDALPSPASQMMFGKAPFHLPLRIIASYAAATPATKLPELPICVCAHGTLYGVHRYELLATYMHPVGPTRMVLSPRRLARHPVLDRRSAAGARAMAGHERLGLRQIQGCRTARPDSGFPSIGSICRSTSIAGISDLLLWLMANG